MLSSCNDQRNINTRSCYRSWWVAKSKVEERKCPDWRQAQVGLLITDHFGPLGFAVTSYARILQKPGHSEFEGITAFLPHQPLAMGTVREFSEWDASKAELICLQLFTAQTYNVFSHKYWTPVFIYWLKLSKTKPFLWWWSCVFGFIDEDTCASLPFQKSDWMFGMDFSNFRTKY